MIVHIFLLICSFSFLLLSGCARLPENVFRSPSYSLADTRTTYLGRHIQKDKSLHPGKSGFVLLDNGLDAFVARVALASLAERSIDVQYYLYHPDLVGGLLANELMQAADRGVRIRILLDDIATGGRDLNLTVIDSHPNIEVRLFNPFTRSGIRALQYITRYGDVTRRMHNKSFTIDNQATIVGGRNIGNEYFDADPDKAFGDLDILAIGPVVKEVSTSFDAYWNSELAYPISTLFQKEYPEKKLAAASESLQNIKEESANSSYVQALLHSNLAQRLQDRNLNFSWGKAEAIYDNPEKITTAVGSTEHYLAPQLEPYLNKMKDELIILSAYFVPGREGVQWLTGLRKQGIRVKILTNSLSSTDVSLVHAGYAKYRRDLLRAGVELYELKNTAQVKVKKKQVGGSSGASLHAKSFIFDRDVLFIGSFNFDPRSFDQNTEIGIIFQSTELGRLIGDGFDESVSKKAYRLELLPESDGSEVIRWVENTPAGKKIYYREPNVSFWQRLLVGFASLLPIEGEL